MNTVADILKTKGSAVHTVDESALAMDAVAKMTEMGVGSLVVSEEGRICGIVSERDFLRKVTLKNRSPEKTTVKDIMTSKVIIAEPDYSLDQCMAIMTEQRIRHLPVVEGDKLVGIVSIGDLIKHLTKVQETHIKYLTDYITGKYPA